MTSTQVHRFAAVLAMRAGQRAWLLWICLLLTCLSANAAAPGAGAHNALIDLHHTSWTAREGAPQMVLTIAQTTDGWLWLGGGTGLFRFDGVRFERYAPASAPLPANGISILTADTSGALWIGYRFGGASVLTHGRLRNYDERDGLPAHTSVWGLEQDGSGRVWAATAQGMFYLDRERWFEAGTTWGLPRVSYKTLMRDRQGVLWAQGDAGVYSLALGAARFVKAATAPGAGVLFDVPDGSIWSWDSVHTHLNRLTQPTNGAPPQRWNVQGDVTSMLFDHAGNLWIGREAGLEYQTVGGVAGAAPQKVASSSAVAAIFEDREGNVWTSTANGIHRFRSKRVSAVRVPQVTGSPALAADTEGGAWVGLFHVPLPGHDRAAISPLWPPSPYTWRNVITCSYRAPDGVLWLGGYGGLWRKEGAKTRRVTLPPGTDGLPILSMMRDPAGGLWVALARHGLYRLGTDGTWEEKDGETGLANETPRAMATAGDSGMWFAYPRNRLLQLEGGRWRHFGPAEGVGIGMAMALHLHGTHVWAGGEKGLALRQGERFIGIRGVDGLAFEGITGIVELDNGDLWLNAAFGLFRISGQEVAQLETTPGHRVHYERIDSLDGLDGNAPLLLPTPSLVQTAGHQLWLTTTVGVFRLDPAQRPPPQPGPAVLIRALGAPGRQMDALAGMRLAPGTNTLQIDYTSLALAVPERVRFRYLLEGVDREWQEAGHRRTAYYSNLGPGDYRFRAMASNYEGTWSGTPAALDFSIAPTPTQTWWFKSLCALALLAAAWMLYRRRIHHLAHQMAERLEERIKERERIARELHDTLLQSVQVLILHVHAATLKLPEPEPARVLIEAALQQADDVLHEGRDRVRGLRAADSYTEGLADALLASAVHLQPPDAEPLRLLVTGTARRLHSLVHEEALAIASEAITNAFLHAKAGHIAARLDYGAAELSLSISDNGIGIPAEVIEAGGRLDHWGISGMRERARRINAKLILRSQEGKGTDWLLVIPGAQAYHRAPRRFWFR